MASLHLYSRESQLLFYDVTIVHINPTKKIICGMMYVLADCTNHLQTSFY